MEKQFFIYIFFMFILTLNNLKLIKCETFEECDGVADETFVASKNDCSIYIYCMGEDSQFGECGEGEYFDPEAMACDAAENVFCALDEINTENNGETDVDTQPEEESETDTETEIDVDNETTTIITTIVTEDITTNSITTTESINTLTSVPIVKETCPSSDNPNQLILIAHNQSCSDYYVCYHGHAIEMHCTNHLHFNAATGQCDYPENVQCSLGGTALQKCQPHVTDFFPHPEKCNYFYYCIRGFLTVQQCPFYYGWDMERRSCVQISQAKCYNNL